MPAQQYSDETNPFAVRPDSDVPVGVQLNWRLRTLILTGRLRSNETLPSVRRLANWAGVNANTVRAVYDALQDEGLITSQQGRGTFVADGARPKLGLESIVLDTVRRGQASGTGPRDLAIALMACADMLDMEGGEAAAADSDPVEERSETIEIRQELRRQIAQLESELSSYVRDLPPGDLPTSPAWADGHLAGVEELEQIRDVLVAKLFKARGSAEERARREGEARADNEAAPAPGPLAKAMGWWREAMESRASRPSSPEDPR
jgi:DNA-binding transcriptional regulator YhcF (GntR family)